MKKSKICKQCKRCGVVLTRFSKTGYCRHCSLYLSSIKRREKRKEEKRCIDCGKKLKPIILNPEDKDPIYKYYYRCYKCRMRNNYQYKHL